MGHGSFLPGLTQDWNVLYSYLSPITGKTVATFVLVGSSSMAQVAPWASPTSVVSVTGPDGTTVNLSCPPLVQYEKFGVIIPGTPGPAPQTNF